MYDTTGQIAVHVCDGDLPDDLFLTLWSSQLVAVDIETSGLDFSGDRIASIQLHVPGKLVAIVRTGWDAPLRVVEILREARIYKLFHYAMFDMRFIGSRWQTITTSPLCTKICSKLLHPHTDRHSLQPLVMDYLGVHLSKAEQTSNWFADHLTPEQVHYAVNDVIYLPQLFMELKRYLMQRGLWHLAVASFEYLPAKVTMELHGIPEVFAY